jgi:pimeloyl-ACP methyl ester carboxylesterase
MKTDNKYFSVREYRIENARKTLFFFPAGFTKLSIYRVLIWQLNKMRIDVVGFDIHWKMAADEATIDGLKKMMAEIDAVASSYIGKNKSSFAVFGTSFGGAIALYVAKRHKEIESVILNVPHATVSLVLWTYKPARRFMERVKSEGVSTERELNKLFGKVECQYDIDLVAGKKIVNFTALRDTIVPNGQEIADKLQLVEPSTLLYTSRFGHTLGGISGLLRKKKWEVVLKD